MKIASYNERGYGDGGYVTLDLEMADGSKRTVELFEDDTRSAGIDVRVLKEDDPQERWTVMSRTPSVQGGYGWLTIIDGPQVGEDGETFEVVRAKEKS